MKGLTLVLVAANLILISCATDTKENPDLQILSEVEKVPKIEGKQIYLESPFVTAGNRVYMVGHQDGSFPEIGWHIKGEMGGIWNHPIKLMDGFDMRLIHQKDTLDLDRSDVFTNYPFGNKHTYSLKDLPIKINRFQFVPDDLEGILINYTLENKGNEQLTFDLNFTAHTDLRPTWLGERTKMFDATDHSTYLEPKNAWMVKDSINPWFVLFGADRIPKSRSSVHNPYEGQGTSNSLIYPISLRPNEATNLTFTIAGSYRSQNELEATFKEIQNNVTSHLSKKRNRYERLVNMSKLTVPDKELEEAFEWLKYNCDWLVRTVPEIGTGITAGIPDYPWWFGVDSEYALRGYMTIGQSEVVHSTIDLLDSVSRTKNGNGKIIHEMSTNGYVFNEGNINETPQFASLIWETYKWNGSKEFLQEYFPTITSGLEWLLNEADKDNNLFPDGFGMMEIHGLDSEMIDVASYTQRAFLDASKIASELNETALAKDYHEKATKLKKKINEVFWSPEFNSYADFIGTDEQALQLIDDAIVRADTLNKPWAVKELQETKNRIRSNPSHTSRAFVLHHNWVVNTPMEMGIADSSKAIKALNTAEKFVNPFGVFVTGIDRDESAGADEGSFKGSKVFSYTGAVMTLPTGVQAIAENNYGRPDKALDYLKRMTRTFSYALPGSIYEVSPDYGMITQAWNIYSYAVPIIHQFFGIDPMASEKRTIIKPQMPSSWNEAKLENVVIAGNEVSITYLKNAEGLQIHVEQTKPDWEIELILYKMKDINYQNIEGYNDSNSTPLEAHFIYTGKEIVLNIPNH